MAENILMFFQQKFCRSISNPDMDRLIVDQLGCMAIARTDNEDKVEDLLAKIILKTLDSKNLGFWRQRQGSLFYVIRVETYL